MDKEIRQYYTDYIADVFNSLNIDLQLDVLYYIAFKRDNNNIRRLSTYQNNLYHNEYNKYYNKQLKI